MSRVQNINSNHLTRQAEAVLMIISNLYKIKKVGSVLIKTWFLRGDKNE